MSNKKQKRDDMRRQLEADLKEYDYLLNKQESE